MSSNPHRLPTNVVPQCYDITLTPDLERKVFYGEEIIVVEVREKTFEIVLNAVELEISLAQIFSVGADGTRQCGTVSLDEATERCSITFTEPIFPGTWGLYLTFRGTLNDKLRGFYRSTYKDVSGVERTLAATQFEATDARRAFPCWDEPDRKAVFVVTLRIDPALKAVSSAPVAAENVRDGVKTIVFANTIQMSIYCLAFIVGELEATEPVLVGQTPLRIWCVPGKLPLTSFGQKVGAFTLGFFEEYYGIPFVGRKLDLLAIPDFAAGAMENFGAITFRETALLVNENTATHGELERVADVVAHESAHMWFGDFVTMNWWNGIWLNEAFATFMETMAVDAWKPEWQRWTSFAVSRSSAFAVDSLWSTRPIEFHVESPKDADAMFDVLTYEKGASILRMLEQYLGPEVFKHGIRVYLHRHQFANADTPDLWNALGAASNIDVASLMDPWVFSPGYPIVSVSRIGDTLILRQKRFTYLAVDDVPKQSKVPDMDSSQLWQIPIHIRFQNGEGETQSMKILLSKQADEVFLPEGTTNIVVNAGGYGFYRVDYNLGMLEDLFAELATLAPIERYNLVADCWAATQAGYMKVQDYLNFIDNFRDERDKNVWTAIISSLHYLHRVIDQSEIPGFKKFVCKLLHDAMQDLGWDVRPDDNDLTRQLRGNIIETLGILGNDPIIQAAAEEVYSTYKLDNIPVDPNILAAVVPVLAFTGDRECHDEFLDEFRSAKTPQEEQRYLFALTEFLAPELTEQTLAKTINGEIRSQDAPFVLRAMLIKRHSCQAAWDFIRANWDTMDRQFPKSGLRRMMEGIIALATPELEASVHEFIRERNLDLGGKTLAQYLEQLRVAVLFTETNRSALNDYFA